MVGGLVEKDDFGFLQQDFGEADAHLPAVAKGGHGFLELFAEESHAGEHFFRFRLDGVSAEMLVAVVEVGELLCQFCVFV